MDKSIEIIVGLGNPGVEYENTRHNAGFEFVDAAVKSLGLTWAYEKNYQAFIAKTKINNQTRWFVKPQTFMNLSGVSVGALANFYKIPVQNILVAHDELDIDAGSIKLRQGGGHAGHNGLKDINAKLASNDYLRLRIGISHPGSREKVVGWVLGKPILDDAIAITQGIDKAVKELPNLFNGNISLATKNINT